MPARMFKTIGRGWSHWIPGPAPAGFEGYDGFDKNPRIFFTLQSARSALTAWLRGLHSQRTTGSTFEDPGGDSYLAVDAPPVERKREDTEIVTMQLTEVA
jgi:hypothetical protein